MNAGVPDDASNPPLTITIGIDGRLYFSEMTPELLAVAQSLCPQDPQLSQRIEAMRMLRNHDDRRSKTRSTAQAGPADDLRRA